MKHLKFVRNMELIATEEYVVFNKKGDCLGNISFDKKWKEWVIEFFESTYMSAGCLKEVIEFLTQMNEKYPKGVSCAILRGQKKACSVP